VHRALRCWCVIVNDFFSLVASEFHARSQQLRQFVRSHGPSIGTANEELLRDFFQSYLPNWVSVGHGFVLSPDGTASKQSDMLIYRSSLYAPLFTIRDFVVVPPESAISVTEVKTRVTKATFHEALDNLIAAKQVQPNVRTSVFIYSPPKKLDTVKSYLEDYDFSNVSADHFPEFIYGLNGFALECANVKKDNQIGRGYLDFTPATQTARKDFVFEKFFYDTYRYVEQCINRDLKEGINNVWEFKDDGVKIHGRLKYAEPRGANIEVVHVPVWRDDEQ